MAHEAKDGVFAPRSIGLQHTLALKDATNSLDVLALELLDGLAHLVRIEHAHLPQGSLERADACAEADRGLDDAG